MARWILPLLLPSVALAQSPATGGEALAASMSASALRMVGSLAVVVLLLVLSAWLVRRWRARQGVASESIQVIGGLSLGAKERIVLLRVGTEQVLVGVSPAGMSSLHVIKDGERRFDLAMGAAE